MAQRFDNAREISPKRKRIPRTPTGNPKGTAMKERAGRRPRPRDIDAKFAGRKAGLAAAQKAIAFREFADAAAAETGSGHEQNLSRIRQSGAKKRFRMAEAFEKRIVGSVRKRKKRR